MYDSRLVVLSRPASWLVCKAMVFALILAFSIAAKPACAAVHRLDGSALTSSEIDRAVEREMHLTHVPGAGIAIFNDQKVVYLKTYGLRDTSRGWPMTPDTVMTAASLTKAAFATMTMQLVAEGVLNLDRPICRYLSKPLDQYARYRDLAGDSRVERITMRMLLSHTAGFPNLRRFTANSKLYIAFTPGARFAYSGEGIQLAQLVVETVTKKSVTDLLQQRLYRPLRMTRSSMVWQTEFDSNFANGYDERGKSLGLERRRHPDAAGSMQTTLRDYARFIAATLQGSDLLKSARAKMLRPQIAIAEKHEFPSLSTETTAANRAIRLSYGLGWGLCFTKYGEAFFKEGHYDGWRHYVVCFDRPGTGILIMTNSSNGESMYLDLLNSLLKDAFTPVVWEGFTSYR